MRHLYTFLLFLLCFSVHAQRYYYNGSENVTVYESDDSFISYDPLSTFIVQSFSKVEPTNAKGFAILDGQKNSKSVSQKSMGLKQVAPALLIEKSSEFKMYPTKTIRVKLKEGCKKSDVLALIKEADLAGIKEKYGVLQISITDIHKSLDLANKIYESDLAEFSMPDFYIPIMLNQQAVQDPLFPMQFQMNNTGQVIDGVVGINDMDCNALEAWGLNLGNNVTVAVLDQGMEAHEDFGNRLIDGFTPATNGNGEPILNNDTHGMECAGVIGASHNNLGVRGVAPNVNFLSVNIFAAGTTVAEIANGIQWAVDNGADVLSNSWSFDVECGFISADIDNAIQEASDDGAVIIFASGNTGGCVQYPASNPNVISVGAFDNRGVLFNYSSRGPELDLTAPSGETDSLGNIRTTDRMDNAGRVIGNYQPSFGGTSAACPVVAGVAALVLSANPNLTPQQVRDILINTAIDMGANGFDNNFGFGRVNAFAAVEQAINQTATLSGLQYLCFNQPQSVNLTNQLGANVTWTSSSNVRIIARNNQSATLEPRFSSSSGNGWVRANLGNGIIRTTNFWVGPASYPSSSTGQVYVQGYYGQSSITLASDALYFFQATGGQGNSGYTWHLPSGFSFNGSSTSSVAQIWTSSSGGNYTLVVRPVNPCGSEGGTRTISIYIPSFGGGGPNPNCPNPPCQVPHAASYGVNANNTEQAKIIYQDQYQNLIFGGFDQNSEVDIYTLNGRKILSSERVSEINTYGLRSGIYLVIVNENGSVTRQKIFLN